MKNLIILTVLVAFTASFFTNKATAQTGEGSVQQIAVPSFATQSNENSSIRDAGVTIHSGMSADSFLMIFGAAEYVRVSDSMVVRMYRAHGMDYKKHSENAKENLYVLRTPLKRVIIKSSRTVGKITYTRKSVVDTYKSTVTVEKDTIMSVDTIVKHVIKTINLEPLKVQVEYTDSSLCTECMALEALYLAARIKQHHTNRSVNEIKLSHKTALAYNKYAKCASLETINLGRRPKRVSKWLWNSNSWFARQILRVKSHAACRKV